MQKWFLLFLASITSVGCGWQAPAPPYGSAVEGFAPGMQAIANPLFVPVSDRESVWNQVVDEIDNYFKIRREERVRLVGHVLTEGRIDTFPKTGSTILEPWRRDSSAGFEKIHASLQSVRRRAEVRVLPTEGGYLLDVAVYKELEDMLQPENSTVGSSTPRHEISPERPDKDDASSPGTLGWIPLGRDVTLEQRILANLRGRLSDFSPPQRIPPIQADLDVNTSLR